MNVDHIVAGGVSRGMMSVEQEGGTGKPPPSRCSVYGRRVVCSSSVNGERWRGNGVEEKAEAHPNQYPAQKKGEVERWVVGLKEWRISPSKPIHSSEDS